MKKALVLLSVVLLLGSTSATFKWKKWKKPKEQHHHHHHHYYHHIHHFDHESGEDHTKGDKDNAQKVHHLDHVEELKVHENADEIKKAPQEVYVVDKNLHQELKYGFSNVLTNTKDSSHESVDDGKQNKAAEINDLKLGSDEKHQNLVHATTKPITNDIFPVKGKEKIDLHDNKQHKVEYAYQGLHTDVANLYNKMDDEKQSKDSEYQYNYFYLTPEEKLSSNIDHQNKDEEKMDVDALLSAIKQQDEEKHFDVKPNFKYYTKQELDKEESEAISEAKSDNKLLYLKHGGDEYKIVKILEVDLKKGELEKVEPKVLYSVDHGEPNSDKNSEEKVTGDSFSKSYAEIWK